MKIINTALAAACLLAVPAGVSATDREPVSVRVSAQGVDFSNPQSVEQFRSRVSQEIAAACNPGDRVGADMTPDFKCRKELASNLAPAMQELARAASKDHLARD